MADERTVVAVQASGDAQAQVDAIVARVDAQAGTENFPVALRALPRAARAQLTRVYRFARFVDDVGDSSDLSKAERLDLLGVIDADVCSLAAGGRSRLFAVHGLGPVLAAGVPVQPFHDLVAANVRDQHQPTYATFDELIDYCRLSAEPVGRVVLHLAGAASPGNVADSDSVCRALQILEHCQDVREDAVMQRIYLPADDLAAAGVAAADLTATSSTPGLRAAVAIQVERAAQLLQAGVPLVGRLRGWARVAVAGYVAGGLATVDALRAHDHDVLGREVTPATLRTAAYGARLMAGRL